MPPPRETHALDRLYAFDQGSRRAGPPPPDQFAHGSGSGEMALSVVLPGAAAMARRPLTGIVLFAVGVVAPVALAIWAYSNRTNLVGFALDPDVLLAVMMVSIGAVVARLLALVEIAHAHRFAPGIGGRTVLATMLVLILGAPAYLVTYHAYLARNVVAEVFTGGSSEPIYSPPSGGVDGVRNLLLLGGDAGPGRWGLRTDTMILVSVHEPSGRTALISIPRNLTRLRFPPGTPLANEFPNGFGDLANAVFPYVTTRPDLMDHYARDGLQPEAVALSEGIGYSLDIPIHDFALVNMQGFTEVIDAVGGVTLELGSSVPLPPSLPGERDLPSSIGPGMIDMDGALAAIAYARSRSADSDYQRMQRQRQLLAALGSQVSAREAVTGFGAVTGVLDDSMRTSLTSGEFSGLLGVLGDNSAIQESVGLIPPLIQPGSPDYDRIREIVAAVHRGLVTGNPSGYGT